jgi:hypothetical protein
MVARRGRTEAIKSAADGIQSGAPGEGDQATGEHDHNGEARVAVGLPGRERERVAFHFQVASTSARQAAWSALAVKSGLWTNKIKFLFF